MHLATPEARPPLPTPNHLSAGLRAARAASCPQSLWNTCKTPSILTPMQRRHGTGTRLLLKAHVMGPSLLRVQGAQLTFRFLEKAS